MNRLKVWLFALLAAGAILAAAFVLSSTQRDVALRALDARLQAGAARFALAERLLGSEAAAVAALAARDAQAALAPARPEPPATPAAAAAAARARKKVEPAPDPAAEQAALEQAAKAAVTSAQAASGIALSSPPEVVVGNRAWLEAKDAVADAAEKEKDKDLVEAIRGAIGGAPQRGWIRRDGKLWYGAAARVGESAGLVLLVPVDLAFVRAASQAGSLDLSVAARGVATLSTARAPEPLVSAAQQAPGVVRGVGHLAPGAASVLGVRIPGARLLAADAPASRVLGATLKGVPGGVAVLSATAGDALQPVVDLQWTCLALAALVVVLGLLAGLLVGPSETAPTVPPELLSAADKIARGDFAARAPALAGQLGTLCEALNKAVEAAQAAAAAPAAPSALAQDLFGGAGQVDRAAEPTFELPPPRSKTALFTAAAAPAEPAPPAAEPAQKADAAALTGAAFEAAPVPPPAPPPEPIAPVASAPEPVQAAAQAGPPPAAEPSDEDKQWREVFRDFLRVRTECGEQAEGLTYERFRTKLESNRATLVAKYGCRTVRFQVYVKEGKAALKATPVK